MVNENCNLASTGVIMNIMSPIECLYERAVEVCIAVALLFMAPAFIAIGAAVVPLAGVLMSIPILITALAFQYAPRSEQCAIYY
jgi:hypothetical protein